MPAKEFSIPEGVNLEIVGRDVLAKGAKGEVKKHLPIGRNVKMEKADGKIRVSSEMDDKETRAIIGTTIAHLRNLSEGVAKGYTYKMRVIYSHFPVTVKVEGDKFLVSNFLGERVPRIAKILGKAKVDVDKQDVTITGPSLDEVSQTAANIEQTCRIVGFDKKVFQDGIYIISKNDE